MNLTWILLTSEMINHFPTIEYTGPAANIEHARTEFLQENPTCDQKDYKVLVDGAHTFDLKLDGEVIGQAEVRYFSKPFPYYSLDNLYVDADHHGNHYSSLLIDEVERFLNERKRAGVLVEAIDPDSPTYGMYARRGWTELPNSGGLHYWNLPKGVDPEVLRTLPYRGTPIQDRAWFIEYEKKLKT